jgi:1-deoxy-D-xylulose-5-phosphate reductoisomerase
MIGYTLTPEQYQAVQGQYINPYQFINCVKDINGNWFFFGNEQDKEAFANTEFIWLFDLPESAIDVVIHPQSIIHALVLLADGSLQAQLSTPSMAYPIQDCLLAPDRPSCPAPRLDFAQALHLELLPPDPSRYPLLEGAREVARQGGTAPAAFNAANEIAVEAFLARRISFTEIAPVVLAAVTATPVADETLEAAMAADAEARLHARESISKR